MKSRKRSEASSPSQPDEPTLFVDASLGRGVAAALRAAGHLVVAHDDVFAQGTDDEIWLARVGKQDWVALTKDSRIRYEPGVREAWLESGSRVFVLQGGNMTSAQMSEAFLRAMPQIIRLARKRPGPFVAYVGRSGLTGKVHPEG